MSTTGEGCTRDCSSCGEDCASRKAIRKLELRPGNTVRHVIGVVSGKGGVGKSIVTSMLAVEMRRRNRTVAILDADITGPSIPRAFGALDVLEADGDVLIPYETESGIRMVSINLLLEDERQPVVWRGPVIAGAVQQFWKDVAWGDIDWMFVDMPPGTGDVPLTVFQSLPVDGIIIVTTPQDLVSMIVNKAVAMAELMNVPVLGLVENMSYITCPDCGRKIEIFGRSHAQQIADEHGMPLLARLPMDPALAALCDGGRIEEMPDGIVSEVADHLLLSEQ